MSRRSAPTARPASPGPASPGPASPRPAITPAARLDHLAAHLSACNGFVTLLPALKAALEAGGVTVADIPALTRRVVSQGTTARNGRPPSPTTHAIDVARQVVTAAAVLLAVPIETWTAWFKQTPGGTQRTPQVLWVWEWLWEEMRPADWTPARITQVVHLLVARSPRLPRAVQQQVARGWADGEGALAQALAEHGPPAVVQEIRYRVAVDAAARPLAEVAADPAPLVGRDEINRLDEVSWRKRTLAERRGVLGRLQFHAVSNDRTRGVLDRILLAILDAEDTGLLPAIRTVVRAQRTAAARAHVIAVLTGVSGLEAAIGKDRLLLTEAAGDMARGLLSAREDALVQWVAGAWSVLDEDLWVRAATQMVRHGSAGGRPWVRLNLQSWWEASERTPRQVPATLVEECLASADRALNEWALVHVVPHLAPSDVPLPVPPHEPPVPSEALTPPASRARSQ